MDTQALTIIYIEFFIILGFIASIAYKKRAVLIMNFRKLYSSSIIDKAQLESMNRIDSPPFIDIIDIDEGEQFKVLIIGNSISSHGPAENIGWYYSSGMAATSESKDFVHLLQTQIKKILPTRSVTMRVSNLAAFERNYDKFDLNTLNEIRSFLPDVIIFQLGENVYFNSNEDPTLFLNRYVDLINFFKNNLPVTTICTTPFFPSFDKNNVIMKVALLTTSFLVDLSHLSLLDKSNYAKFDGAHHRNKKNWKVDGIGIHPGDYGMNNIANQIFITISAIIHRRNLQ